MSGHLQQTEKKVRSAKSVEEALGVTIAMTNGLNWVTLLRATEGRYSGAAGVKSAVANDVTVAGAKIETTQAQIAPPVPVCELDDNDVAGVLSSWFAKRRNRTEVIFFANVDNELALQPGTAKRLLEVAVTRMHNCEVENKGLNTIKFRGRSFREMQARKADRFTR